MPERLWDYPIITRLRKKIRERTPGEVPAMTTEHPVIGLVEDVRRLVRRRAREVRRRILGGRGATEKAYP